MSTNRKTRKRQEPVVFSETVIFGLVLGAAVVALPLFFGNGVEKEAGSAAPVVETVIIPPNPAATHSGQKPVPYLRQLPSLLPYINTLAPYFRVLFLGIPSQIISLSFRPLSYAFRALSQILAPLILLIRMVVTIFVITPWNCIKWVGGLLYPIYVFCSVAALVGAGLALAGVLIGRLGVWLATADSRDEPDHEDYVYEKELRMRSQRRKERLREREREAERGRSGREGDVFKEEPTEKRTRKKGKTVGWADHS